jgi:hypothetical protein
MSPLVYLRKRRHHQIPAHKRERGSVAGLHLLSNSKTISVGGWSGSAASLSR